MRKALLFLFVISCAVGIAAPVRSMLGGDSCGHNLDDVANRVPYIRITPITTATHYSPFNTGEAFTSNGDWRVVAKMRIVPGSTIGSWGRRRGFSTTKLIACALVLRSK